MDYLLKARSITYEFLEPYARPILGKKCTHSLLKLWDFGDKQCVERLLSKGLSYGIIAGSALVKLPQIFQIALARSGKGVSPVAYWMETLAFSIFCAYNYRSGNPFSTYGEGALISVQNVLILWMLACYSSGRSLFGLLTKTAVFGGLVYSLLNPAVVSNQTLIWLQGFTILLSIGSKVPQIFANWRAKSIGQLSRLTVFLTFAGSFARVFTTYKEVDDQMLLINTVLAAALNFVLFTQTLAYTATPNSATRKHKKRD